MVIAHSNSVAPPFNSQFQKREVIIGRHSGVNIGPVNFDWLNKPVADFGKHLRKIFENTSYGILQAVDYTSKPEIQRSDGSLVSAIFEIYELLHNETGKLKTREPCPGLIQIISKDKYRSFIEVIDDYSPNGISRFEDKIKNYDLKRIRDISFIPDFFPRDSS